MIMQTTVKTALLALAAISMFSCSKPSQQKEDFPREMTLFTPYEHNPVFAGTGRDTWDKNIRERGYILYEDGVWRLWYTGYNDDRSDNRFLGLATSDDGLHWQRWPGNPLVTDEWVEDMQVIKQDDLYYMFAEGRNDIAHLLISGDGTHWQNIGDLDIRMSSGEPISEGPYGTPTVWFEDGTWHLFYERNDLGIWLAASNDLKVWTNVQDDPVIKMGPEEYDQKAVAMNQVIKYKGRYFGFYHATAFDPWRDWTTNVAMSEDLIHWRKYPNNPIIAGNKSSGILVWDDEQYRLYTMHPDVRVYFPHK